MLVDLIQIGEVKKDILNVSKKAIKDVYKSKVSKVRIESVIDVPFNSYDKERDQYDAEILIQEVEKNAVGDKNIGITSRDIFYGNRNYVFGLAYLGGKGCIVSTYRLKKDTFGKEVKKQKVLNRVRKEVIHELGHTLGLEHCKDERCVMSFSPTVNEVDEKRENRCKRCKA